jgi:hypothetical protein
VIDVPGTANRHGRGGRPGAFRGAHEQKSYRRAWTAPRAIYPFVVAIELRLLGAAPVDTSPCKSDRSQNFVYAVPSHFSPLAIASSQEPLMSLRLLIRIARCRGRGHTSTADAYASPGSRRFGNGQLTTIAVRGKRVTWAFAINKRGQIAGDHGSGESLAANPLSALICNAPHRSVDTERVHRD